MTTRPEQHRQGRAPSEKKKRQLESICYLCDLSVSLKEMCNERFTESSTVGARGHPQKPAVAIGIAYPWQQRENEGKQD